LVLRTWNGMHIGEVELVNPAVVEDTSGF
jgi:hypothetical protein